MPRCSPTKAEKAERDALAELSVKRCSTCKKLLHFSDFGRKADMIFGLQSRCKGCIAAADAADPLKAQRCKEWAAKNPEKRDAIVRRSYLKHEAARKARWHKWAAKNRDSLRIKRRESIKRRYQEQPWLRLGSRVRSAIRGYSLRNGVIREAGAFRFLDYSVDELSRHIERQFLRGMSWENMSEWHIDHIIPLSHFKIERVGDEEFRKAWALPNLRPLWALDNISKNNRRLHLL